MKSTQFAWIFFLLYGALRFSVTAQTLTPDQLQADFARFRMALQEAHPEMYRYTTKAIFDSLFTVTASRLNRPMTQHDFYVTMTLLLVALRDGHIKWIVPGKDEHYPFYNDKLFPLKLYFLGDKAWIVDHYGNETVPIGAEVISINGQPMATIINQLLPHMTFADGYTINAKYQDLTNFFPGYYSTFVAAPNAHEIVYRTDYADKTVRLAAVTYDQIKAYTEKHESSQKPFRLLFADTNTAVITIEGFTNSDKVLSYQDFLKQAFRDIKQKQIKHLILDLRNNEGGEESFGVLLYQYLAGKPFRYYDYISVRQKKNFSFPAWTSALYRKTRWLTLRKRGAGYVFTKQRGLKPLKPKADAFGRNLYVLINGYSFSVSTEFAARLHADKQNRSGTTQFVGQETGGGYDGNTSGVFAITQLPNSKIDLGIGLFGFHMADLPANRPVGRGIIPDHTVVPNMGHILTGQDPVMTYTLQLIRNKTASTLLTGQTR